MRVWKALAAIVWCAVPACTGQWSSHYEGARLNALGSDAPVKLVPSSRAEVERAQSPGFVLLGRSEFEQNVDAGEGSLEEFARSIGSPMVLFSIEDAGEQTRRVRKPQYVPSSGGTYVDADGVVRPADITTNNYMYIEVEREVTEQVWKHAAAFLAPAEPTQPEPK